MAEHSRERRANSIRFVGEKHPEMKYDAKSMNFSIPPPNLSIPSPELRLRKEKKPKEKPKVCNTFIMLS